MIMGIRKTRTHITSSIPEKKMIHITSLYWHVKSHAFECHQKNYKTHIYNKRSLTSNKGSIKWKCFGPIYMMMMLWWWRTKIVTTKQTIEIILLTTIEKNELGRKKKNLCIGILIKKKTKQAEPEKKKKIKPYWIKNTFTHITHRENWWILYLFFLFWF